MAAVRRVGVDERRTRLAIRHRLAPGARAGKVADVARDLVALHSTDPGSVYLSVWARTHGVDPPAIDRALYDERSLVRMLGMRRTLFVVAAAVAPVVQAACTTAIAARERQKLLSWLRQAGTADDPDTWLDEVEASTMAALVARGEASPAQLAEDEPRLKEQIALPGPQRQVLFQQVGSRVVWLLAASGRVVRTRPVGTWISNQYRWSPIEAWLPEGWAEWPVEAARAELARCWLAMFGPATIADLKWWAGWTLGETRRALAEVGTVEVDLDGEAGVMLVDDQEPTPPADPWTALLPALDPTVMGWAAREWYLGEHRSTLFDRNGNAGPTIWWDGRVVGGWAQRRSGEIVIRLLEDVGSDAVAAVESEADRLSAWLGDVRVTPRFRTPLERELSA